MFLSNWLVFKIVLAAVTGLVDYPLAADVLLKYDNANKLYLDGNSIDYVSNVVLYKGETSYDISESLNVDVSNEQIIFASDGASNEMFGAQDSVAISGNYAIVGAETGDSSGTNGGAAYIFVKSETSWTEQAKLLSSDIAANDSFGSGVDIDGDYAIVGAKKHDSSKGAAYIFHRSGTNWVQQDKIVASDAATSDRFGQTVAIEGDYVIVGSPKDDTNTGSVYIFKRSGTSWSQQDKITANNAGTGDEFGAAIAISGDYVIVGALLEDTGSSNAGAAYIFKKDSGAETWTQQVQLQGSTFDNDYYFGRSVSISGDYAIVGADKDHSGGTDSGAAFIFKKDKDAETWTEQAKLLASDIAANDGFGYSVSISGSIAVVSSIYDDSNKGAAYVFRRSGTTWTEVKKITKSIPTAGDLFGTGVYIDDINVIVGASGAGAAYIYSSQLVTNYYITQPGTYRADLQICGIDYKTNEVEVTGTPSDIEVFKEPETDFTASKAVLSSTSSISYHQGGMSDNGEYYYYGQQVYKKDTGSFTYTAYGSALSTTIFEGSWSSISHDGNYIVSYYTNSTYQLHIIKNNGSTFVNHQTITSPNVSAQSQSHPNLYLDHLNTLFG